MSLVTLSPCQPAGEPAALLDRALWVLALLILGLSPTQYTAVVHGIALHPADPLLGVAGLIWLLRRRRMGQPLPPFTHWALVLTAAAGVCVLPREAWPGVLQGAVKLVLYLLAAVAVFRAALTTLARVRVAVVALLLGTTVAVGFACWQRHALIRQYHGEDPQEALPFFGRTVCAYTHVPTPSFVCSTFGAWSAKQRFEPSRTLYAAFLALVLPWALALIAGARPALRAWLLLLFAGAGGSVLAGMVVPALLLGLLVCAWALGPRLLCGTAAGVLLFLAVVLAVGGITRWEVLREPYQLAISPRQRHDGNPHLKRFWGEQQVDCNLLRVHPLLGVGTGQYQQAVNQAWGFLGGITVQWAEPDTYNGYLVTAATTGVLGLLALLALLGSALQQAWDNWRAQPGDPWRAAALGTLVALLLVTFVTLPYVRGLWLPIAFTLAVTANLTAERHALSLQQRT
jgi:O-antigen ligase